jgi:UDP-sugar pyrophosphorylase
MEVLENNHYYGMTKEQVTVVQQVKVPALINSSAHFSIVEESGKLMLETKPHGHGDIHTLLYMSGCAEKWYKEGKKWLIFFQDTNPLAFRCYLALLGVTT